MSTMSSLNREVNHVQPLRALPLPGPIPPDSPGRAAVHRHKLRLSHLRLLARLGLLASWQAAAATLLVWPESPNPTPPYGDWATAAHTIHEAADMARAGDTVLVTNGVYATGGRAVGGTLTNRVAVTRPLILRSVNGPAGTVIEGYQVPGTTNGDGAVRCVYLADGATLSGFTLAKGATLTSWDSAWHNSGGGVFCESTNVWVTNCVITANTAQRFGGGAYSGTLILCTLIGNSAYEGGGACESILTDCVIMGNSANSGGGVRSGTLNHCTVTGNAARSAGGGADGGALSNCLLKSNSAANGGGAFSCLLVNCVLAGNRAGRDYYSSGGGACESTLDGCTITGNWSCGDGGGTYRGRLNACTLVGNSASDYGGGACVGTLSQCVLIGNSARAGGGTGYSTLDGCTLIDNSASAYGGGAFAARLSNCILYRNSAVNGPNYISAGAPVNYCCTTPLPTTGTGNITNEPAFLDLLNGDLRLQSNSPCINAGSNAFVSGATDLDGNPRVVGGTVDIGAYELQTPASLISYAWLQQYGLPTDGSADYAEPDGDGLNNWLEWLYGTDPTNAMSALSLFPPTIDASGVTLSWASITNHTYFLERSADLGASLVFHLIATNLAGLPGTTSFTDTNPPSPAPSFYRVGIQP